MAVAKDLRTHGSQRVGKADGSDSITAKKRIGAEIRDGVRKRDRRESTIVCERMGTYTS